MTDDPAPDDRTPLERMEAGDLYIVDHQIATMHQRAAVLCRSFNATTAADPGGRRQILDELLGGIGPDSEVRAPLYCDYGTYLRIGARTFVNFGLVALDVAPIIIGDDVQIGPNVQLLTATHPIDAGLRRNKWEAGEAISIGDNVWLGGGVIVLAGVTIGDDTIVGAGAVVTRDLPAGVVAVGNPATVIRTIDR
ncbi:MAG TPA: sugar O-acetyltransferase [Acidimicrobiales bacterium]